MRVEISRSLRTRLIAEALAAPGREVCGLLFGEADRVRDFTRTANVAEAPDREFEIGPAALFAALRAERAGGPKLIGYWHSHPGGDAAPSRTDAAGAAPDGKLWLIVGGGGITLWRAGESGLHGRFEAIEITGSD